MKDELVAVNRVLAYAMRLTPRERAILVEALLDEPAAMGRSELEPDGLGGGRTRGACCAEEVLAAESGDDGGTQRRPCEWVTLPAAAHDP